MQLFHQIYHKYTLWHDHETQVIEMDISAWLLLSKNEMQ